MHRCVCIWRYILQNYNYKLHFQNLSTYHIPHVSIGTLAAENLDVCTACDPWDRNIPLTMVKDRRPGSGMPFPDSDTCAEGGVIYFCRVFFPVWCHTWMDDRTDGWMEKASRPRHPLLYVIIEKLIPIIHVCVYVISATLNQHPPAHHPLDVHYYSVVDEPQLR